MIVDAHVHVWEVPPIAPVGQTSPKPIIPQGEAGTAEELIDDMDANGVDKAVLVQASFSTWYNRYVADSARKFPDRFVAMGLVDPLDPDNASVIRYWAEERGMVGFRFHPMYYDDEAILTVNRNAAMWEAIDDLGAVVQLHILAKHAPQVAAVAENHPAVPIVLDHLAYPDVSEAPRFASHRQVLELALFPNVFVKVSDVHDHSGEDLPYRDIHPFVRQVQDAFGTDRLMWGTGYPGTQRVKNGWPTLADELRLVREGYDWLTDAEKARLLGGTAEAVWGL